MKSLRIKDQTCLTLDFRSYGCFAFVRILEPKRRELASIAYERIFIGYALNNEAYRFFDLVNQVFIESNDVDFLNNLLEHQMNVKTTFLNGELEEGIYMEQQLCCPR